MEIREPPATYAAYARLPADSPRYEIIGGVGSMTPAPGIRHQIVSANLHRALAAFTPGNGILLAAPVDVVFSEQDVVQPDLVYVSPARRGIIRARGIFGAPDLLVEILSPATCRRDFGPKFALYAENDVREYWIVDPGTRSVDQWQSGKAALDERRILRQGETLGSLVLPDTAIEVAGIFAGIDEIPKE